MAAVLPKHVAIIMDGNGRWATARGLSRYEGHKKGAEAARVAVEAAAELGIEYVTLFGFSSENWSRPQEEIEGLMGLLRYYLQKEISELHKNGVRLRVIGDRTRLDSDIVRLIENAESITAENKRVTLTVAFSYGGRQDITFAARALAEKVKAGELAPDAITEELFASHLMTQGLPDPDLLIRTSGEARVSNFLMWQMAYAEIFFTPTLWPDFSKADMEEGVRFFQSRERRFGGLPKNTAGGVV